MKIFKIWIKYVYDFYAKGYRFLSFAKNMGKNIDKNISKSLSGKYSLGMLTKHQKLLYHVKQSATDALKTSSKRIIQKTAEVTGDLIGNKITNKLIWLLIKLQVSKNSPQNNSGAVKNEHDKQIPKEKYVSPEERREIIDELRLK